MLRPYELDQNKSLCIPPYSLISNLDFENVFLLE